MLDEDEPSASLTVQHKRKPVQQSAFEFCPKQSHKDNRQQSSLPNAASAAVAHQLVVDGPLGSENKYFSRTKLVEMKKLLQGHEHIQTNSDTTSLEGSSAKGQASAKAHEPRHDHTKSLNSEACKAKRQNELYIMDFIK